MPTPGTAAGLQRWAVGGLKGGNEFVFVSQWFEHDKLTRLSKGTPAYKSTDQWTKEYPGTQPIYALEPGHFISETRSIWGDDDRAFAVDADGSPLQLPSTDGQEGGVRVLNGTCGIGTADGAGNGRSGPALVVARAEAVRTALDCDEDGRCVLLGLPLAKQFRGGQWRLPAVDDEPTLNDWASNVIFLTEQLADDKWVEKLPHACAVDANAAGPAAKRWARRCAAMQRLGEPPQQSGDALRQQRKAQAKPI